MTRLLAAIGCALLLAGCTAQMQVVTNVTTDGTGGLVIERATITHNSFTGEMLVTNRTATTIHTAPRAQETAQP